jgi:hypothetical protein
MFGRIHFCQFTKFIIDLGREIELLPVKNGMQVVLFRGNGAPNAPFLKGFLDGC